MYTHLVAWLVVAMHAWGARPEPAAGTVAAAVLEDRYSAFAEDFVSVAFDPDEAPVYGGPGGRVRTLLLLTSIAANESRYDNRIARGHCRPGECDHGRAVGLFQIHAGPFGIELVGGKARQCTRRGRDCITANELARDTAWYRDHPLDADVAELAAE